MSPVRTKPRLGVVIHEESGYERAVALGAARYAKEAGMTALLVHYLPGVLSGGKLRGLGLQAAVVALERESDAAAFAQLPIPVVNVGFGGIGAIGDVIPDVDAVANLVARRARALGYVQIAFYARHAGDWSNACLHALERAVLGTPLGVVPVETAADNRHWRREVGKLTGAVAALPPPRVVVAATAEDGRHVLESLRLAEIDAPAGAAVLSIGNDELLCNLSAPTLSSVDLQAERVGYEAAGVALASGERGGETLLVPPSGIIVRHSFGKPACADPLIAACDAFIHANAARRFTVPRVAQAVGATRRTLERRYHEATGRTVASAIRREHIARACWLLAFTDKPIKRVAVESGFSRVEYFTRVFGSETGETPGEYRRRRRLPVREGAVER